MKDTHHRFRVSHGIGYRQNNASSSATPAICPPNVTDMVYAERPPQWPGRASIVGIIKLASRLAATAVLVFGGGASADPTTYNIGCNGAEEGRGCVVSPWTSDYRETEVLRRGFPFSHYARDLWWWERNRLENAMRRFPDAVSCLDNRALGPDGYDLTAVAWSALNSDEKIEVCLTRIHNAIGDPDNSVKWFEAIGYTARLLTWRDDGYLKKWVTIGTTWLNEDDEWPWKLSFRFEGGEALRRFSISVSVDEDGRVRDVLVYRTYE